MRSVRPATYAATWAGSGDPDLAPVLALTGVSKTFGRTEALRGVFGEENIELGIEAECLFQVLAAFGAVAFDETGVKRDLGGAAAKVVAAVALAFSVYQLIIAAFAPLSSLPTRSIHVGSPRQNSMFLPYNCTTTTRDLADSQLFGHRRGSFTGAVSDQPGLIRSANGGTLFLDEIGDLPIDVQPKLLRFLEQREIMPIGETRPLDVDVRTLAATNADLEQRVAEGKFREDLYYRLSVIRIHVPPLRERRVEIPHLTSFFLREAADEMNKPDVEVSADVLDLFAQYLWPGNIRQLRNEVKRAVALSPPGGVVTPDLLSPDLANLTSETAATPVGASGRRRQNVFLSAAVDDLEREMIRTALDRCDGNISESARQLGLTRRGLYLKMRRLGFEAPAGVDTK